MLAELEIPQRTGAADAKRNTAARVARDATARMVRAVETLITRNAAGDWLFDGEVVRCNFGGYEGLARAMAIARQIQIVFERADEVERERLYAIGKKGFNSIEALL